MVFYGKSSIGDFEEIGVEIICVFPTLVRLLMDV
jgi:hypothetical protein